MKFLKILLIAIYIILIALLLLTRNCSGCSRVSDDIIDDTTLPDDTIVIEAEAEDTAVVAEVAVTEELRSEVSSIGEEGDLKVTLLWDFPGDIDLHIVQPNRTEISCQSKEDYETGGSLDVDNRSGGTGAAENIYWYNPPKGLYTISLDYYAVSSESNIAGSGPALL